MVEVSLYFGKKKLRMTAVIVAAVILFAVAALCVIVFIPGRGLMTVSAGRKLFANERYIIHAGGGVADAAGNVLTYTNSREALENCYASGNRIAEFDLMVTSDDRIVCAHADEESGNWAYGVDAGHGPDYPPTYDDFMAAKFDGTLTTMSFDDLAAFMNEHPDFYVVTDTKDDNERICGMIRDTHPELAGNLIVQIYHSDEYDRIRQIGFPYMIYTLYMASDEERTPEALASFTGSRKLIGVTFWDGFTEDCADSFEALCAAGVPMFVHTINDKDEMRSYINEGVCGIYTDVTDKEEQYR